MQDKLVLIIRMTNY